MFRCVSYLAQTDNIHSQIEQKEEVWKGVCFGLCGEEEVILEISNYVLLWISFTPLVQEKPIIQLPVKFVSFATILLLKKQQQKSTLVLCESFYHQVLFGFRIITEWDSNSGSWQPWLRCPQIR